MSDFYYLEFTMWVKSSQRHNWHDFHNFPRSCSKSESRPEEFLPVFVKGAIVKSLKTVFGEIGGETELDLLTFDDERQKGIVRTSIDFAVKTRAALTLISEFQGIPATFQVNNASQQLLSLTETFLEI
jgi:ribonuclease P protein subunit RPP14